MHSQIYNFLAIINSAVRAKVLKLKEPDWDKLLVYAISHNIEPLVYEGCSKYKAFHEAPVDIRNKYLSAALTKITGQIHRTRIFLDIYNRFTCAGLKPLVLKGIVCRSLYGELADHRPSTDEDIYIKAEELSLYRDILEKNGFAMEDQIISDELLANQSHISFFHKKGLKIELHFNLMNRANQLNIKMNSCFDDAFDGCISQNINGHMIYTMNHTKSYLYLFMHLYKHFVICGVGIRQVLDLLLYGERYYDEIDWDTVEKNIQALSADKLYADILMIGSIYFDFNIKTSFAGNDYSVLLMDIMNAGIYGKATPERRIGGNITISAVKNGKPSLRDIAFPDKELIKRKYKLTDLKKRQIVRIWIRRVFKFLRFNFNIFTLYKSIRLGRYRAKLLKNYGIIDY